MASTFKQLVIWRSVFLFFGFKIRVRVRVGLEYRVRARFRWQRIIDNYCRYVIREDRVPVAGTGYTTFFIVSVTGMTETTQKQQICLKKTQNRNQKLHKSTISLSDFPGRTTPVFFIQTVGNFPLRQQRWLSAAVFTYSTDSLCQYPDPRRG